MALDMSLLIVFTSAVALFTSVLPASRSVRIAEAVQVVDGIAKQSGVADGVFADGDQLRDVVACLLKGVSHEADGIQHGVEPGVDGLLDAI
eukprot:5856812-Pyramimonas_sp.AAC.1